MINPLTSADMAIIDEYHNHPIKPNILALIEYYYSIKGNEVGGILHIALDDGNLENEFIYGLQKDAEKADDTLAMIICDLLLQYSEEEREEMFNNNHWSLINPQLINSTNPPTP